MRRSWSWLPILVLLASLGQAASARAREDAPWHAYLFSLDGATLGARQTALESGVGYNGVTATSGGLQPADARRFDGWLATAFGLADRVELDGAIAFGDDVARGFGFGDARVELRVAALTARPRFPVAIAVSGGYQADPLLQHGLTGAVAVSADLGRVNLTVNLRAAHYFHDRRDPVDLYVTAGASVRATAWLRVGAEYVGEELEADDADGGGRHYVGPAATLLFAGGRLRVSATGGVVRAAAGTGALARGAVAYGF